MRYKETNANASGSDYHVMSMVERLVCWLAKTWEEVTGAPASHSSVSLNWTQSEVM